MTVMKDYNTEMEIERGGLLHKKIRNTTKRNI